MGVKGIKVVYGHVSRVDPENRKVYVDETITFNSSQKVFDYDYLVLAPGVVYDGSKINGYEKYWYKNTTVYDVGRVNVLRKRIWSMNSGKIVVYAPKTPYRCAPAPTETALLIHTVLKYRGVREVRDSPYRR